MKDILEKILELLQQLAENNTPPGDAFKIQGYYMNRREVAKVLRMNDLPAVAALLRQANIPEYKHGREFVIHTEDFLKAYDSGRI